MNRREPETTKAQIPNYCAIDTPMSMTYVEGVGSESNIPEDGLIFLESPSFSKRADQHLGEVGREALFAALLEDPEAGAVVADTDGARKIRVALPGRGKSGGAKKELRKEVRRIKEEAYP